jgi:hypothetical protein
MITTSTAPAVLAFSEIFVMSLSTQSLIRRFQAFHIIGVLPALLLALLLAFGLAGCSTLRLGYNNAPELIYWWLDSYLDFNATQSPKVRAELAALQAWHRQSELPAYVRTLEKLQRMAPSKVTPEQVCDLFAELKPRFQGVLDQAEPALVALAPTLTTEQLDHLAHQFDKRNTKWREEWLEGSPAERSARRVKQLTDRAEMLYQRLEETQLAVLRSSAALSGFDAATSYREALRRQQDTLQTLRQLQSGASSAASVKTEVHALLGRSVSSPDAAYRDYSEKMTQASCKAFASLHNSATPAQRLKLIDRLRDYETDAQALMAPAR